MTAVRLMMDGDKNTIYESVKMLCENGVRIIKPFTRWIDLVEYLVSQGYTEFSGGDPCVKKYLSSLNF